MYDIYESLGAEFIDSERGIIGYGPKIPANMACIQKHCTVRGSNISQCQLPVHQGGSSTARGNNNAVNIDLDDLTGGFKRNSTTSRKKDTARGAVAAEREPLHTNR